MLIKLCLGLLGLALAFGSAFAMDETEIGNVILLAYPGATIVIIETQIHKGEDIFQVDFHHGGEVLQAILSLDGDFINIRLITWD